MEPQETEHSHGLPRMQSSENKEQSPDESEVSRPSFQTPLQLKASSAGFLGVTKVPSNVSQVRDDGSVVPPWFQWLKNVPSTKSTLEEGSLDSSGSSQKTGVLVDGLPRTTDSTGAVLVETTTGVEDEIETKTTDLTSDVNEGDETDSDDEVRILDKALRLQLSSEKSEQKEAPLPPERSPELGADRETNPSREGRRMDENVVSSVDVNRLNLGHGDFQTENRNPLGPGSHDADTLLKAAICAWINAAVNPEQEAQVDANPKEEVNSGLEKVETNLESVDTRLDEAVNVWIEAGSDAGLEETVDARLEEAVNVWIEEARVEAEALVENNGRNFGEEYSEANNNVLESRELSEVDETDLQSAQKIDGDNEAEIDSLVTDSREENHSSMDLVETYAGEQLPDLINFEETSSQEKNAPESKSSETNLVETADSIISDTKSPEFDEEMTDRLNMALPLTVEMKTAETQTTIFDLPESEPDSSKSSDTEYSDSGSSKSSSLGLNVGFWKSRESFTSVSRVDHEPCGQPEIDNEHFVGANLTHTIAFVEDSVVNERNQEEESFSTVQKPSTYYEPLIALIRCTLGTWMRFWGPLYFQ